MRNPIDVVEDSELNVLNGWPEGTQGYHSEDLLIKALNALCRIHGYGRVHQLTEQIRDIWYRPEKQEEYAKFREDHLKRLAEGQELLRKEKEKK